MKGVGKTKHVRTRTGAALIAVTAMIVVVSLMVAGVYYLIHRGTEVSGLEKRYRTAREASFGGMDVFLKEIVPQAISGKTLTSVVAGFSSITSATVTKGSLLTDTCFSNKLLKKTADWGAGCDSTMSAKTNPDVTFTLSGVRSAPFNVYAKIVDTVPGNSDISGVNLEGGGGVAENQSGLIAVQHFPYLYRMEVQGEKRDAPEEKAGFAVLYAY